MIKIKNMNIILCIFLLGNSFISCNITFLQNKPKVVVEEQQIQDLVLKTNRTEGVAPFAVFLEVGPEDTTISSKLFHDVEYRWNFGDTANPTATWNYGSNPGMNLKNEATGPIAAHVYEEPGIYTVTCTIWAGEETYTLQSTTEITVTDPDTVFAGKTAVISNNGDFTGKPTGASEITETVVDDAIQAALAGGATRILFKRGQTFNYGDNTTFSAEGPVLIGAFGTGNKPILNAVTGYTTYAYAIRSFSDDVRVMDLEVNGNDLTVPYGINSIYVQGKNSLLLRIYSHNIATLGAVGDNGSIVECESDNIIDSPGNMSLYLQDVFGLFVAGCRINNGGNGEYNFRYQGGIGGIISNNTMEHCGDGKAMITIRGDYTQTTYTAGRHIVSDNKFDGASSTNIPSLCSIVPQNKERDEKIVDVIWERNYHNTSSGSTGNLLMILARGVTVRNNLFDASEGTTNGIVSINYGYNTSGTLPAPEDVHVYHNTFFTDTTNGFTGVSIRNQGAKPRNTIIMNNFMYAPNTMKDGSNNDGPDMYTDEGIGTLASGNTENISESSEIIDAFTHLAVQPPTDNPDDWKLLNTSYAYQSGEAVPVWSDFFRNPLFNSSKRNLGAIME